MVISIIVFAKWTPITWLLTLTIKIMAVREKDWSNDKENIKRCLQSWFQQPRLSACSANYREHFADIWNVWKPIFVDVVPACTAKKTVQMKQKLSVFGCLCSFWYLHLKVCSACACACGCISSQFCQCNSPELKFLCENNESSRRVHRRRSKVHRRSKDDSALQKKVCCSLNLVALFKSSQLQAIHCNV